MLTNNKRRPAVSRPPGQSLSINAKRNFTTVFVNGCLSILLKTLVNLTKRFDRFVIFGFAPDQTGAVIVLPSFPAPRFGRGLFITRSYLKEVLKYITRKPTICRPSGSDQNLFCKQPNTKLTAAVKSGCLDIVSMSLRILTKRVRFAGVMMIRFHGPCMKFLLSLDAMSMRGGVVVVCGPLSSFHSLNFKYNL